MKSKNQTCYIKNITSKMLDFSKTDFQSLDISSPGRLAFCHILPILELTWNLWGGGPQRLSFFSSFKTFLQVSNFFNSYLLKRLIYFVGSKISCKVGIWYVDSVDGARKTFLGVWTFLPHCTPSLAKKVFYLSLCIIY